MKWHKNTIDLNNLPSLVKQLQQQVKAGDESLETLTCIFTLANDSIIYKYTIFDWLDNLPSLEQITSFTLCQALK